VERDPGSGESMTGPESPRVSVVIVSYNAQQHLLACLRSLRANAELPVEVVVVDNASRDGSAAAARAEFPEVRVVEAAGNLGFSKANNLGIHETTAPYVWILNPDTEVQPGNLACLARILDERADVGLVGPRTVSTDGAPQVSFGEALTPVAEWLQQALVRGVRSRRPPALRRAVELASREREPGWISASCVLARRTALDAVGGFDEGFFLYEEDVDLCLRLHRGGWRIVFTPATAIVHHLGKSGSAEPLRVRLAYHRSHLRFYQKHNTALQTALLRGYLGASALVGLLGSLVPGPRSREQRAHHLAVLALAVFAPRRA
jgi:N-acetylglucosaminyl-diphospho-decaprenol L-rhamnosyltransferase